MLSLACPWPFSRKQQHSHSQSHLFNGNSIVAWNATSHSSRPVRTSMQPAVQSGQAGSHARLFRSGLGLQLYCSHPTLPSNLAFVAPSGTAAFLGRSNAPLLHPPLYSHLLLLPTTIPYFNHLCISSSDIFFTFIFSPLRPHSLPDFTFSPPLNPFVPPSLRPLFFSLCHSILRPSVSRLPQHTTATPPHQKNVYSLTQSQNRYLTAGTLRGQRFKCSSSLSWQWR